MKKKIVSIQIPGITIIGAIVQKEVAFIHKSFNNFHHVSMTI